MLGSIMERGPVQYGFRPNVKAPTLTPGSGWSFCNAAGNVTTRSLFRCWWSPSAGLLLLWLEIWSSALVSGHADIWTQLNVFLYVLRTHQPCDQEWSAGLIISSTLLPMQITSSITSMGALFVLILSSQLLEVVSLRSSCPDQYL